MVENRPMRGNRDRRIAEALSAVQKDLARQWTTSQMAHLVNLSPSRFEHLFVEVTGVSPRRYVLDLRLKEAHRLLSQTFLSVKEVAQTVGFQDRSYFNRVFKSRFGYPPRDARQKNERS